MVDGVLKLPLPDGCELVAFADDLVLLTEAANPEILATKSNNAIEMICNWGVRSKLSFNQSKTKAMIISTKRVTPKVFFPRLTHRESVPRLQLNFYTTQFLSGHGKFSQFLNRFRLRSGDRCECGDIQTGFHMLLDCPIFEPLRFRLRCPVHNEHTSILAEDDVFEELNHP